MSTMDDQMIAQALEAKAELCSASRVDAVVPTSPGFYSIFIDKAANFPCPFSDYLHNRETNLLYIGIASESLFKRLVEQDLHHRYPSTFFRGIGAILGYRPQLGSLVGKRNQNNYKFARGDTAKIIAWINQHLAVRFVAVNTAAHPVAERKAIQQNCPILNTIHNPACFSPLAELRSLCRSIARQSTA